MGAPAAAGGPLEGRAVLVPRARDQADTLSTRIRALGGEPVVAPTIEIVPGDEADLRRELEDLADGGYTAVTFTSPNGVEAVAAALDAADLDASIFATVPVAVVGPGTARRLREALAVEPDFMPESSTTAALAATFPPAGHGLARVLLPRADIATAELPEALASKGYTPVVVAAYRTIAPDGFPPGVADRLEAGDIDVLAFTSSSTVRNFAELVDDRPWTGTVVSIGPVTSETCRELGIEVAVEAEQHDLDGLVDALVAAVT